MMLLVAILFVVVVSGTCVSEYFENLNVPKRCVEDYCFTRIIWEVWDSDVVVEDVLEIMTITRETLINFTFCFVTYHNVSILLDLHSFPPNYNKFKVNRKTDIIKVRLLEKYGGVYTDASTYVNSGEEMEWFFAEAIRSKAQLVAFWTDVVYFGFWGCPENSSLIKVIREEHDLALQDTFQFVKKTCEDFVEKKIPYPLWLCCEYDVFALAGTKVMHSHELFNKSATLLPGSRGPVAFVIDCEGKRECILQYRKPDFRKKYGFLKIVSEYRLLPSKTDKSGYWFNESESGYSLKKQKKTSIKKKKIRVLSENRK